MRNVLKVLFCLAATAGFAAIAEAQIRFEVHPVQTRSPTMLQFLNDAKDARPAQIAGELRFPLFGETRMPAVILVHGSGGIGSNVRDWADLLNKQGYAVFLLDSFSGRGITSTVADQTQLSASAMLYDSWRALEMLAKHPRIDPGRIAIMGFSKGGFAALYSALTRFQKLHGPQDLKFAGHIVFYAACNTSFAEDLVTDKTPIRFFHGLADDYTLAEPCRTYASKLKETGNDAVFFGYAGAHHAFDAAGLSRPLKLRNAVTARTCRITERPRGALVNEETGKAPTLSDPCIERGATIAHSAAALAASRKEVAAFLKALFKKP